MKHWYLLRCKARQEKRAEEHLANQSFSCYNPMVWVNKPKVSISKQILEPLFPGYLFIELEDDVSNWGAIRCTRGVLGFVRFGQYPTPVLPGVVQNLMETVPLLQIGISESHSFTTGDNIRITEGCFAGLNAIYQCESGKERAIILLNIVGNSTAVQIDKMALEKV